MASAPTSASAPTPATAGPADRPWSGRTRGGYLGNWFFIQLIRWGGRRCAYAWLVFVAAYFTLASPAAGRASRDYLLRVFGPLPFWRRPLLVYRHFFAFGVTLLDRLAVFMGQAKLQCRFDGEHLLTECLARGEGLLLVSAHLGSWEIGGQLLDRLGRPVNLVVLERELPRLRQLFDQTLTDKRFRLLTTDEHPLRSLPILAALRRGEIVALHGDRTFGGADLPATFLGAPARFPLGAYRLAAASGAPLFQVFVVRERLGHYRFLAFPAQRFGREFLRAPEAALQPAVDTFAQRLETVARQYPFQWGNFYPFWDPPPNPNPSPKRS